MPSIHHVACWVVDLEGMKDFYCGWFGANAGAKYCNERKGFESYFLSLGSGARLELMRRREMPTTRGDMPRLGWAHIAISVGSCDQVDRLTNALKAAGITVLDGPRRTGDGYYESVVLDPEGNAVEITE